MKFGDSVQLIRAGKDAKGQPVKTNINALVLQSRQLTLMGKPGASSETLVVVYLDPALALPILSQLQQEKAIVVQHDVREYTEGAFIGFVKSSDAAPTRAMPPNAELLPELWRKVLLFNRKVAAEPYLSNKPELIAEHDALQKELNSAGDGWHRLLMLAAYPGEMPPPASEPYPQHPCNIADAEGSIADKDGVYHVSAPDPSVSRPKTVDVPVPDSVKLDDGSIAHPTEAHDGISSAVPASQIEPAPNADLIHDEAKLPDA